MSSRSCVVVHSFEMSSLFIRDIAFVDTSGMANSCSAGCHVVGFLGVSKCIKHALRLKFRTCAFHFGFILT